MDEEELTSYEYYRDECCKTGDVRKALHLLRDASLVTARGEYVDMT